MKITTVIVDDEAPARNELRYLLQAFPFVEVTAEAASGEEALPMLQQNTPQLLFLDINMPGWNGFDFLQQLNSTPRVVFVTAYDQYAIRAFETHAFDYLLKPVLPERLEKTMQQLVTELGQEKQMPAPQKTLHTGSRFFLKDGNRCFFIQVGDVYLFEAAGNYVKVYFKDQSPLLYKTMQYLEMVLPPDVFFKCNRSQLVNLHYVERIDTYYKGGMLLELHNKTKVEVSQRQAVKFREQMGL